MSNKKIKTAFLMFFVAVLCFTLLPVGVAADFTDGTGSITLTAVDKENKEFINGAVFRLFAVADARISESGIEFTYNEAFRDNGMPLGNLSDEYLPVHLAAFAAGLGEIYIEMATDDNGTAVFENLPCGAYLVVPSEMPEAYLVPASFVVSVPVMDEAENKWIYDVDALPKIEGSRDTDEEKVYMSVKKYWDTTDNIPDSITVALIKDGIKADTVVLNAENNWYYRWDSLDKNHAWNVVEEAVPDGYFVTYSASQMTVSITNTRLPSEEEETTPPEDATEEDELIETGQLNWPVPVFTIAGLLIFSLGWSMLKFSEREEEAV